MVLVGAVGGGAPYTYSWTSSTTGATIISTAALFIVNFFCFWLLYNFLFFFLRFFIFLLFFNCLCYVCFLFLIFMFVFFGFNFVCVGVCCFCC